MSKKPEELSLQPKTLAVSVTVYVRESQLKDAIRLIPRQSGSIHSINVRTGATKGVIWKSMIVSATVEAKFRYIATSKLMRLVRDRLDGLGQANFHF